MGKCKYLFIKSIKINNVNEFLKIYEESQCILNEKVLLKQVMYCNEVSILLMDVMYYEL